jgi:hypothetical protein
LAKTYQTKPAYWEEYDILFTRNQAISNSGLLFQSAGTLHNRVRVLV